MWFYHRVMNPKDADGMANNVDPDQTRSSLICGFTLLTHPYLSETLTVLQYMEVTFSSFGHLQLGPTNMYHFQELTFALSLALFVVDCYGHLVGIGVLKGLHSIPLFSWRYVAEPRHKKTCLMLYANNKCADQPTHTRILISVFVVRCLDSIIPILAISKMSRL